MGTSPDSDVKVKVKPRELSAEDRAERRRKQNRDAARRCRQRRKNASSSVLQNFQNQQSTNTKLKHEIRQLETEIKELSDSFNSHLPSCRLATPRAGPAAGSTVPAALGAQMIPSAFEAGLSAAHQAGLQPSVTLQAGLQPSPALPTRVGHPAPALLASTGTEAKSTLIQPPLAAKLTVRPHGDPCLLSESKRIFINPDEYLQTYATATGISAACNLPASSVLQAASNVSAGSVLHATSSRPAGSSILDAVKDSTCITNQPILSQGIDQNINQTCSLSISSNSTFIQSSPQRFSIPASCATVSESIFVKPGSLKSAGFKFPQHQTIVPDSNVPPTPQTVQLLSSTSSVPVSATSTFQSFQQENINAIRQIFPHNNLFPVSRNDIQTQNIASQDLFANSFLNEPSAALTIPNSLGGFTNSVADTTLDISPMHQTTTSSNLITAAASTLAGGNTGLPTALQLGLSSGFISAIPESLSENVGLVPASTSDNMEVNNEEDWHLMFQ